MNDKHNAVKALIGRLNKLEEWLASLGGIDTDLHARTVSEALAALSSQPSETQGKEGA